MNLCRHSAKRGSFGQKPAVPSLQGRTKFRYCRVQGVFTHEFGRRPKFLFLFLSDRLEGHLDMRISVATKLMCSFVIVVILTGVISIVVGIRLISGRVVGETQEKVRNDLNAAREIYLSHIRDLRNLIRFTADRYTIREAMIAGRIGSEYQKLKRIKDEEGLDILTVMDREGKVILRVNNPVLFGDSQSNDELVECALGTKKPVAATKVVQAAELEKESKEIVDRAYFKFIETPKARPRRETEETAGMMISAAAPILDFNNNLMGIVYGGILLNRNYEIVDKIKQTVYQGMKYKGKDMGTATIFQDDVRISTNVLREDGSRAVGTRLAENVYEQVIAKGAPWIDRAFVVNNWYITAYEPIKAINGKIIGILYVGVLEEKYDDIRRQTILIFLGVTTLSLITSLALSYLLSGNISSSIGKLASAARQMATGKLDIQVDVKSKDEVGELAGTFNFMAAALRERDEKLKEFATKRIMESERLALIGQLAAGVAHEINNPLQGILAYSCLLVEDMSPDDQNRGFIEKIAKQATRCKEIVRGLLDFSRQTKPEMMQWQMNSVVRDSLALVERQSLFHNIEIVKKFQADLPGTMLDASQMQQVLMNIIINASEAMGGKGKLSVATRTDSSKKFIEVEIADTGVGISRENLERIFDPFFTTKQVGHGTGLGLAISYGVVKRHNGSIEVRSEVGKGTTFTVRLPIIGEAEEEKMHAGVS
jgi:two-component system NtrC family sensor kinase